MSIEDRWIEWKRIQKKCVGLLSEEVKEGLQRTREDQEKKRRTGPPFIICKAKEKERRTRVHVDGCNTRGGDTSKA